MSFDSGSFALSTFRLPEPLPEDALNSFSVFAGCKIDNVKDEPSVGWVSGRHLLETDINEVTSICGGHLYLHFRVAERKIPTTLLNAIIKKEELLYMEAENVSKVPSKIKKQIKIDTLEKYTEKMPPILTGVPIAVDMKTNMLYFGGTSNGQIDNFLGLFTNTLEIEPIRVNMMEIVFRLFSKDVRDLPSINFSGTPTEDDEHMPERDFLTWLWYHSETKEGYAEVPDFGRFALIIEGPLTFAFSIDDAKGAGETTVKKGCPLRSAEAKAALTVGKKLKKAKITVVKDQQIWSGTFDADKFTFSGFNLPEGEEMETHSRFAERMNSLFIFQKVLETYVKLFVETLESPQWLDTERAIQKWAQERDSL